MLQEFKKNIAFTLAEVLITLGVIGVIASMTIPTLINNTNENEFNAGLKKAYSTFSQAMLQLKVNGVAAYLGSTTSGVLDISTQFRDDLCTVLSCVQKDGEKTIFGFNGANYKWFKGAPTGWPASDGTDWAAAALKDGTFIEVGIASTCSPVNGSPSGSGYDGTINICGWIRVDINGSKQPNMFGKDLYDFSIAKKADDNYIVVPDGVPGDGFTCVAGSTNGALNEGCTYQRLFNPDSLK